MPLFQNITSFPFSCIYALIDKSAGNILMQWSAGNAVNQLSSIITNLRRGVHNNKLLQHAFDRGNLSLEILKVYDIPPEDIVINAETSFLFHKSGLLDMSGKYNKVHYTVVKRVMRDCSQVFNGRPLVYVTLQSRSAGSIVAAIFDNMIEADAWIEANYPGQVDSLIFGSNQLTREYHRNNGYKLIRFKKKKHSL